MKVTKIEQGVGSMMEEREDSLTMDEIKFGAIMTDMGPCMQIEMRTPEGEVLALKLDMMAVVDVSKKVDGYMDALKSSLKAARPELGEIFEALENVQRGKGSVQMVTGTLAEIKEKLESFQEDGECQCDNCRTRREEGTKLDKNWEYHCDESKPQ